uniref:Uncharacterized protein n=1 Tax=Oryza barthii TaxID=65489 RepID=A0A0D3EP33_9ORYZ
MKDVFLSFLLLGWVHFRNTQFVRLATCSHFDLRRHRQFSCNVYVHCLSETCRMGGTIIII